MAKKRYMATVSDGHLYIYDKELFKSGLYRVVRDTKTLDTGEVVEDLPEGFEEELDDDDADEDEPVVVKPTKGSGKQ